MQVGIGRGTDSGRITQAHVLPLHGEVKFDLAIVGTGVSAEGEQPAAGARGESFDLKAILIKYQRSVDLVESARQIGISDGTVRNLESALRRRMCHCSGDSYVYRYYARRCEIWIVGLDEFQVDAALGSKIQLTFAAQLHRPGCQQVGALARETELFNPEKLARQAKTHWTIIVNLDVFYVGIKIAQISDNVQFTRPSKRPLQTQISGYGRMSGNTSLDIGSQQCVDIELIEVQVYGRQPITPQMNIAVNGQFCMLKLGLPGKVQVCPLCNSVNRKVAGALVIERKVMHSKSGIHGGCIRRART